MKKVLMNRKLIEIVVLTLVLSVGLVWGTHMLAPANGQPISAEALKEGRYYIIHAPLSYKTNGNVDVSILYPNQAKRPLLEWLIPAIVEDSAGNKLFIEIPLDKIAVQPEKQNVQSHLDIAKENQIKTFVLYFKAR